MKENRDSTAANRQRIQAVIDAAFAGSQRALANKIGVSPATLSLVLSGLRAASPKLLHAISMLPFVSNDWLATGAGEPLTLQPQILTDRGCVVPRARRPLAGRPVQFQQDLDLEFVAVQRAYFGADVYALRLAGDNGFLPVDKMKENALRVGDLLIIDASLEVCRHVDPLSSTRGRVLLISGRAELIWGSYEPVNVSKPNFDTDENLQPSEGQHNGEGTAGERRPRAVLFMEPDENETEDSTMHTVSNISTVPGQSEGAPEETPRKEVATVVGVVNLLIRPLEH